jgi:sugar lactone lactonase YvrE
MRIRPRTVARWSARAVSVLPVRQLAVGSALILCAAWSAPAAAEGTAGRSGRAPAAAAVAGGATAVSTAVPFTSEDWVMANARVLEHAGREALMGFAYLKDVAFTNGVIEADVYAEEGVRSYPGVVFRVQSQGDYEEVYLRPHRSPFYPDAIQYCPVINGIAGWQLYHGEGFTSLCDIPTEEWVHLKVEVSGTQARVFLGEDGKAALEVHDLKHGLSHGTIGLRGQADRTAYFSNFSYRVEDGIAFDAPPIADRRPGMITDWEISKPYRLSEIDPEILPSEEELGDAQWGSAESEPSGLVDVARYHGRTGREPDCVYARATITSEADGRRKYALGYSDDVHVFLNGEPLFHGMSAYRQRDPSFLGVIGLNDAVYLPLKRGDNELVLLVAESFGGWGLMCGEAGATFTDPDLAEAWSTDRVFLIPETVVYDPARDALYVSNYDMYGRSPAGQFVSKVTLDGRIVDLEWAKGLYNPIGMALGPNRLYVVERRSLVEIDPETGEVLGRHQNAEAVFMNDLAVADDGAVYLSDSGGNAIFRFADGEFEKWLVDEEIGRPNGMDARGSSLAVANNGDTKVKLVDLETKAVSTLVDLGPGTIDGIESTEDGSFYVSQWEGKLFRVSPSGAVTKLLDTTMADVNCANFAYAQDEGMILIPTFMDNRIKAYRVVQ